jgi:gliding motility-associated-like protein
MTYLKDSCPQGSDVGGYSIVHSPGVNCFTGDWVNFTGDHTGDPNGYFMLINASTPPSDFYRQRVDGLCAGTSYQFSAWIVNMASHSGEIDPNITFSIQMTDGTLIQSFNTGPVSFSNPAQWNQYAFYFTTPPGVSSVVISIRNNAPGGYGNDLGLDDIGFRTSGPSIGISIDGHSGDTAIICSGPANGLGLTGAVGSCYSANSYQWQTSVDNGNTWTDVPGAVNSTYSSDPVSPGNYLYRLAAAQTGNIGNSACRVVSAADTIVVLPLVDPSISIAIDAGHFCVDSIAVLSASAANGGSSPQYQWMVNGLPVAAAGPAYSSASFTDGDVIDCRLTSNAVCSSTPFAASNDIVVSLLPDVTASVGIVSSANNICQDSLVTFTATPSNGGNAPLYQWQVNGTPVGADSSAYSTRRLNEGDVVNLIMKSSIVCSNPAASDPITMTVYDVPVIQLTPDTIIAAHSHIILDPVITGQIVQWQWTPATDLNDPSLLRPTASPIGTTVYQLIVSNDHCSAFAAEKVEVFYDLLMPNAFTPNGDGRNDLFRVPPSIPVTIMNFVVYDRLGKLVFATADAGRGWDGRVDGQAQPSGTYVWMIEYNNPILKKTIMKKGTVELIR